MKFLMEILPKRALCSMIGQLVWSVHRVAVVFSSANQIMRAPKKGEITQENIKLYSKNNIFQKNFETVILGNWRG